MATRVLSYECKYCGALKRTLKTCLRHEATCLQNPNAKNCVICENMKVEEGVKICGITGKRCSVAVSAKCKHFSKRDG